MSVSVPLKLIKAAAIFWSMFIISITGLYVYWMRIDDNPPVAFERFEVGQDVYGVGDPVNILLEFCKYTDAPPTVAFRAQKIGANEVYFATLGQPTALKPGCYSRSLQLNFSNMNPGEYILVGSFTYRINPVRERSVITADPVGFTVVDQ